MRLRIFKIGLCLSFVFMLCSCDKLRGAEYFVERAESQIQLGNFKAATADLKTALLKDDNNIKAQLKLAEVAYRLGDYSAAQDYLNAIEKTAIINEEIKGLSYRLMLAQGMYDAVIKAGESEKVISESMKLNFMAQAFNGLGQYDRSFDAFGRGLSVDPKNIDILNERAKSFIVKEDYPSAEKDINAVLGMNPDNAMALYQQGLINVIRGDIASAKASLEKSASGAEKQLNYLDQIKLYALLSEVSLRLNNIEDTKRWVRRLEVRAQRAPIAVYYRARQLLLDGQDEEALRRLQQIDADYDYLPAKSLLAQVLISKKSYEQAEEILKILSSKHPEDIEIKKLLSSLYMETNRYDLAIKTLPIINDKNGSADPEVSWLRGRALFSNGSRAEGLSSLKEAVDRRPDNQLYALQLARAYIIEGKREQAINLLNSIPESVGSQRDILLVLASVLGKNKEAGEAELKNLLSKYPNDSGLHSAAAMLIQKIGELDLAASLYKQAIKIDEKNSEANFGLADLAVRKKDYKNAETYLAKVLSIDSKSSKAALALAAVYLLDKDKTKAKKQLEMAISNDPSSIDARFMMSNIYLSDKDYVSAKKTIDQAILVSENNGYVINQAGMAFYEAKQYNEALAYFERASALGVSDANIAIAKTYLVLGQLDEARKKLELAATNSQTRFSAIGLIAQLYLKENKLDLALVRIGELAKEKAPSVIVNEMYGDAYATAKEYSKAVEYYSLAYKQKSSQALAIKQHNVRLRLKGVDPAASLNDWLKEAPEDLSVIKLLAGYMTVTNKKTEAIKLYERIINISKSDPEVLNNLAWLYSETNDKRAFATAETAYSIAPDLPEVLDTYGCILLKNNRSREALTILTKSVELAKTNLEIRFHHAKALVAVGDKAAAKKSLEEILSGKKDFSSISEAKALYQSL